MAYKDRRTALIFFGVLTIAMGSMMALFIPLMLFGATMAAKEPGSGDMYRMMSPACVMYGTLAIALIWLGIGSATTRRWARALLLIFSWSWLIVGMISAAGAAFVFPKAFAASTALQQQQGQPQLSASAQSIAMTIILIFYAVILILLPAIWVWFYQSKNVKATCEARDPHRRWTDRSPLPVIALSLWLAFGSLAMLALPFAYRGAFPFFGTFLSGIPGTIIYLVMAVIWAYAAWTLFRLQLRGWWLVLVVSCTWSISSVLTCLHHDLDEMYQLMGIPHQQTAMVQQLGLFNRHVMAWSSIAFTLPFLGYLLFIRRYFRPT
jgi:hypothetical protein